MNTERPHTITQSPTTAPFETLSSPLAIVSQPPAADATLHAITFRAIDILRIALMQGELDNLRNDLAHALKRNDVAPDALDKLLQGIVALRIRLPKTEDVLAGFVAQAQEAYYA